MYNLHLARTSKELEQGYELMNSDIESRCQLIESGGLIPTDFKDFEKPIAMMNQSIVSIFHRNAITTFEMRGLDYDIAKISGDFWMFQGKFNGQLKVGCVDTNIELYKREGDSLILKKGYVKQADSPGQVEFNLESNKTYILRDIDQKYIDQLTKRVA